MPSTLDYRGEAPTIQQHQTADVGSFADTETFIVTFTDLENGGTEAETATLSGWASTTEAAAYILSVLKASSKAIFQSVTFSVTNNNTLNIKGTSGRPFSVAFSGTGTWDNETTVKANSGPNDFMCPANYEQNVAPGSGDSVILHGNAKILWNTYQAGTTFGKLDTSQSWSGRTTKIQAKWTAVRQRGPGELNIDVGNSNIAIIIDTTAQLPNNSLATNIWGTNILSLLNNGNGAVGLAPWGGVASACPLITNNGGRIVIGSGVTATTIHNEDGMLFAGCGGTTLNARKGTVTVDSGFTWTNYNHYEATSIINGIATNLNLKGDGFCDTTQSSVARTFAAVNGACKSFYHDSTVLTITADNRINKSGDHDTALSPIGPAV